MTKNVFLFGFILGTLLCINLFYTVHECYNNPAFESNNLLGYVAMILISSIIFFGILKYRNKQLNGIILFGQAFKAGALMVLVASTMYVVVWLFYYYLSVPDFIDKYTLHVLTEAVRDGASADEMATKTKEMAEFKELYKNPIMIILITYMEVVPVGLIVALVSAFILKKKK